jgi:hypothetical protein
VSAISLSKREGGIAVQSLTLSFFLSLWKEEAASEAVLPFENASNVSLVSS